MLAAGGNLEIVNVKYIPWGTLKYIGVYMCDQKSMWKEVFFAAECVMCVSRFWGLKI